MISLACAVPVIVNHICESRNLNFLGFGHVSEHTRLSPNIYFIVLVYVYIKQRHLSDYKLLFILYPSLAASGDLEGLEIWSLAGADLNKPGYDGQTAIEVVGFCGTFATSNENHG